MRYILDISYNGNAYFGFQVQPEVKTVQGNINRAISTILRKDLGTYSAGRTDRGVHGLHMPTLFEFEGELPETFLQSVNAILPADISVDKVWLAGEEFNPRFDAVSRRYKYRIVRHKSPFETGISWYYPWPLDLDRMQKGAEMLKEYTDFGCFCKSGSANKTNICKITDSYWEEQAGYLFYHVKADRFLRGMVRAIVGTLIPLGKGKITLDDFRQVLESDDRREAGGAAPPEGLFLVKVEFPEGLLKPYMEPENGLDKIMW